jgi:hypothetical protein
MILHRTRRTQPQDRPEFERLTGLWGRANRLGDGADVYAFDIHAHPDLLPNLALLDLQSGRGPAVYRYVGTRLQRLLGRDVTGLSIAEVYPPAIAAEVLAAIGECRTVAAPLSSRREFRILRMVLGYDRLLLPFGTQKFVTLIAVALYPVPAWLRQAAQWQRIVDRHLAMQTPDDEQRNWASAISACRPAREQRETWFV